MYGCGQKGARRGWGGRAQGETVVLLASTRREYQDEGDAAGPARVAPPPTALRLSQAALTGGWGLLPCGPSIIRGTPAGDLLGGGGVEHLARGPGRRGAKKYRSS